MATKAKYSGLDESVWVQPLELTSYQNKILSEICNDPNFVECVREIAEDFRADTTRNLATEAEVLATLKELKKDARELADKLRKIPSLANAYLWEASRYLNDKNDLDELQRNLMHLFQEAAAVIAIKDKEKKTKIKSKNKHLFVRRELSATSRLKQLFIRCGLPWNANPNSKLSNPATSVLVIVFEAGGKTITKNGNKVPVDEEGVAEYIKILDSHEYRSQSLRPRLFPQPPNPNAPQPDWDLIIKEHLKINPNTTEK